MNYIIKTEPLKQTQIGKPTYNIVGVKGRMFDLDVTLETSNIEISFYFEFIDEEGNVVNSINANRNSIIKGIKEKLPVNLLDEQKEAIANQKADEIILAILAGTKEQKYQAMQIFANSYGLSLKQLEEQ